MGIRDLGNQEIRNEEIGELGYWDQEIGELGIRKLIWDQEFENGSETVNFIGRDVISTLHIKSVWTDVQSAIEGSVELNLLFSLVILSGDGYEVLPKGEWIRI